MGLIDWLANIDPSARVLAGSALCAAGLLLAILRLSYARGWSTRPPTYRPAHGRRLIRRGAQIHAVELTRRLRAELDGLAAGMAFTDAITLPAGVPLEISARAWLDDAPTWPQPRVTA